jgi:putative flippase GtrA
MIHFEITRAFLCSPLRAISKDCRNSGLGLKAITFALIGLFNTGVDYGVFLWAHATLTRSEATLRIVGSIVKSCHCGNAITIILVAANIMSWTVAVTSSYVLNSSFTFAAESGRKLRLRDYIIFVVANIFGLVANTGVLVVAAEIVLLPIWLAKMAAIGASFIVNFSLSHFVVFRVRDKPAINRPGGA